VEEKQRNALSCGCGHCHEEKEISTKSGSKINETVVEFIKVILSSIILCLAVFLKINFTIKLILYVVAYLIVGYKLFINCVKSFVRKNIFNECLLMIVASVTAFCLQEYFEGVFVVILYSLGELLEDLATDKSRRRISGLSKLKISLAHLITPNGMKDVHPKEIAVGQLIEVKSGETVPIDGILIGLRALLDVKSLTGESKYLAIKNGEDVLSGAINVGDPFVVKTSKEYKDSVAEKIIEMVEGATSKKAKTQKFINSFARIYTPIVFVLAILLCCIPPLFDQMDFYKWAYKGLSFLVISCPCALVISVPLSYYVSIGTLAKNGVLVKGGKYLDILTKVKTIAFDKTGTITEGRFTIKNFLLEDEVDKDAFIKYLVAIENYSVHPIAKAIVKELGKTKNFEVKNVQEIKGQGVIGVVDKKQVIAGSYSLLIKNGIKCEEIQSIYSCVYLAVDGKYLGCVILADKVKINAEKSLNLLSKVGVKRKIIVSGDNQEVVKSVCEELKIDEYYSGLLPGEKSNKLQEIKEKAPLMYVGDGINDAPSLAIADVGVAMGGIGSEIAIDSADVVLMDDDLTKLSKVIRHAKKTRNIVLQNIVGSLSVKFIIMILSVMITLPVWLAMVADVGVMLLAVANSLRNYKIKRQ